MGRCASEKKISKKVIFPVSGDFVRLTNNGPLSVKALLHRGLLLAQRLFLIIANNDKFTPVKCKALSSIFDITLGFV